MSNKYPGGIITSGANAGYSVFFDGTGDYLSCAANTAFAFSGDFTIEFWFYQTVATQDNFDKYFCTGSGTGPLYIDIQSTANVLTVNDGSTVILTASSAYSINVWNHIAVSRSGTSLRMFLNGVQVASATNSTSFTQSGAFIGGSSSGTQTVTGHFSNFRIVKGTALYTAAFTPPTQLFAVTNTSLLTCNSPAIVDQSSNNFTITANGNAAVSTFTPFVGTQLVPNPNTLANTQGVWSISDAAYWMSQNKWPMPPNYPLQSLRFNSADSTSLTRTPASAGSRTTWTWSGWLKRTTTGSDTFILSANGGNTNDQILNFYINSSDKFVIDSYTNVYRVSTQVFRDVGAWYHIVVVWDTTNATAQSRARVWVNNTEITAWDTNATISSGQLGGVNGAFIHSIGRREGLNDKFFNGYMTIMNMVDGQALTPSSFGANDPNTGVWSPVPYSGTYGTNGFRLSFQDNTGTTATTLGRDYSGNGNNWTPNNFSVAAGVNNDSLTDGPTNWGIDYGNGGEVRGNYCTLNPLFNLDTGRNTVSDGNLKTFSGTGDTAGVYTSGTFAIPAGKWYWEGLYFQSADPGFNAGIGLGTTNTDTGRITYNYSGTKTSGGSTTSYGAAYVSGDIIGVAMDMDAGSISFYKNGVSQGVAVTGISGTIFPMFLQIRTGSVSGGWTANFGQRPFAYPAPPGFKCLCSTNLPTPTVGATSTTQADDYFNAVAYSGNSSTQTITTGFQPDLVWIKSRSTADVHTLQNVISGARYYLISNSTAAEATQPDSDGVSSFTSTGFSLGYTDSDAWNKTGNTYISWAWKAGGTGVSNTAGSISSTVSANTTAGFSVVAYTGTGSNATVGHGIGVAPSMIIVKRRGAADTWRVYHSALGNTKFLNLNETAAAGTASTVWNNTSPTSTVFSIGTDSAVNSSSAGNTFVAYCFAEIAGFSKFGSYTGNASTDGPFVYLGFRPRFILAKRTDTAGFDWVMTDSSRSPYNVVDKRLFANTSDAESSATGPYDYLSNGFKLRNTNTNENASGGTYIYMAFAESPFNYSRAR